MQHGLDKLNSYHVLGSYLFEAGSLEDMKTFFEEHEAALVQEWAKEKDPTLKDEYTLHRASLKLNLGSVLFNYGDFDGAAEQARNAMEYCRENEQWVQYYKHYLLLVEALTASLKYE
ncbi:MAG: hypothetical protein LBN18_04005, partial [Dysgonamonadaceae bacterium]|nr:hypothetical protein [Dysgonamonadaceae bacterium]